jgi:hypothetical protein
MLLVLLLALTWVLPQMPGQLASEAGAADRWLAATTAAYGALGAFFRSLGLFQIMHSPLLQLLLALLMFALLVQLARLARGAYALRKIPAVLDLAGGVNGEPLPVLSSGELLRWRLAHPSAPLTVTGELHRLLDARLRHIDRRTVRVSPAVLTHSAPDKTGTKPDAGHESRHEHRLDVRHEARPEPKPELRAEARSDLRDGGDGATSTLEERLLALRGLNASLLRPLLPLGMLCALALIWINAAFGWEFTAFQLAPGERTADPIHDVRFEYHLVQPEPDLLQPSLIATIGDSAVGIPVTQEMTEQVGNAVVRAEPGAPGLLVQTIDNALLLARFGQAAPVAAIGLAFPNLGSEETLLLPQHAVGLRIVRLEGGAPGPAGDGFLVEVFQGGNERPVARITVDHSEVVSIPTFTGDVPLAMTPLPALNIQVQHAPGFWLLWPALALLALGALGFARRPGFILAQIGPWPPERAVVTLQSDLPGEMASLRRWYDEVPLRGQKSTENADTEGKDL